jgi:hypothetical protein
MTNDQDQKTQEIGEVIFLSLMLYYGTLISSTFNMLQ